MKKLYNILCVTVFISIFLTSLFIPRQISVLTEEALSLCISKVIPSLFPFTAAAQILSATGVSVLAGRCLSFIITPMFGIPKSLCGAFLTGFFGGFPSGAHAAGIAYKQGICTKSEAEHCVSLSNNCSVPFLISVVGASTLGSIGNGIILLASQLLCIIITSALLRILFGKPQSMPVYSKAALNKTSLMSAICKGIPSACIIMLNVCGFITFFYVLSGLITSKMPDNSEITAIVKGIFEMSCGIDAVKNIAYPLNFIICSAIIGFSGISVIFQVIEALEIYGISSKQFLASRLISAILMPVITSAVMIITPGRYIHAFSYYNDHKLVAHPNLAAVMLLYAVYFVIVMLVFAFMYLIANKFTTNEKHKEIN